MVDVSKAGKSLSERSFWIGRRSMIVVARGRGQVLLRWLSAILLLTSIIVITIAAVMSSSLQQQEEGDEGGDIEYEVSDSQEANSYSMQTIPVVMQSTPALAALALALTVQEWRELSFGKDKNISATDNLSVTVERLVSLFLIRIVALVSHRNHNNSKNGTKHNPKIPKYTDLSTSTICRKALIDKNPWPKPITTHLINQLRTYVRRILEQYKSCHYHGFEHAYHVALSCNKLLDLMLSEEGGRQPLRKTYGLKSDPLLQIALLFSALVHDVEHTGVSNRQLVLESDELAILYNDQSVAEQRSLAVAFSELKKEEYKGLMEVLFPRIEDYRRFRKAVINLVLSTDIASPERTQLVKSKWKEAFGETKESIERKVRKEMSRRSVFTVRKPDSNRTSASLPVDWKRQRRHNSMPRNIYDSRKNPRQRSSSTVGGPSMGVSSNSVCSELTMDPSLRYLSSQVGIYRPDNPENGMHSLTNINDEGEYESDEDTTSATPESADGLVPAVTGAESDDGIIQTGITLSAASNADPKTVQAIQDGRRSQSLVPQRSAPMTSKDLQRGLRELSVNWPVPEDEGQRLEPVSNIDRRRTDSFLKRTEVGRQRDEYARMQSNPEFHRANSNGRFNGTTKSGEAMTRRFSSPDLKTKMRGHSVRLGIRRSMDLTGEVSENYSASSSSSHSPPMPNNANLAGSNSDFSFDTDEPDELKTTVVMEHILRAADVAPNMQSWDHMKKWSTRLFFELMASFSVGRGEDPQPKWYENQTAFLESYILPLARRLDDTGVFGNKIGAMFAEVVEENMDRWVTEGSIVTSQIIYHWKAGDVNQESSSIQKLEGILL